jgi:hypothetical protein
MKKLIILIALIAIFQFQVSAQVEKYTLSGGEWIFSVADQNQGLEDVVRFSPVFNFQSWRVYDYGNTALFYGLSLRNVGFIVADDQTDTRTKYRTYNLGLPVGIILNFTETSAIYAGYELEAPFHYKEKTFVDGDRINRSRSWFSDRVPNFTQSVFLGFQFHSGSTIKFKYYLDNFFNQNFSEVVNGVEVQPYSNFEVNVFYVALQFSVLRGTKVIERWE